MDFKKIEQFIEKTKLPVPRQAFAKNKKQAVESLKKLKSAPKIIMKLISPDFPHKTEFNLVRELPPEAESVEKTFDELVKTAKRKKRKAKIEGVLLQEKCHGVEVIIGMKRDPTFGPVLLFGLGGIFAEILQDKSLRIAPVKKEDAFSMIKEIKGYKILTGYRNLPKANLDALSNILVKLGNYALANEKLAEIDLNPVIVDEKKAYCVDIRIIERK